MTAAVLLLDLQESRRLATANDYRALAAIIGGVASIISASPATAQVNAAISLFNDYRFRGYSLSDGRPTATLDLSYDTRSGFYGNLSGSGVAARDEGLKPLGIVVNGGYATQLSPRIGLDLGATHSSYSKYSDRAAALSYSEAYIGISGKLLSARLNLSPDYIKGGSAYAELNGSWALGMRISLIGHAGLMVPFESTHPGYTYSHDVDWRLGLVRQFGPLSVQAAWSGVRPGRRGYRERTHSRDAVIFGFSYSL